MAAKSVANKNSPHRWTKGESGNPKGAPKRGESWAELFNTIGNLTPDEVAEMCAKWAAKLRTLPKGVTLKTLVVIRAYTALLDESNARLLAEVMNRAEGKTVEKVENSGEQKIELIVKYATDDKPPAPAPEAG